MKLTHHIALALRQRPLLLPMLAGTICVDALFFLLFKRRGDTEQMLFWGGMVPQIGLLSLWLANGLRYWLLKFVVTLAVLVLMCVLLCSRMIGVNQLAEALTLLSGYAGAIFVLAMGVNLALGYFRPLGEPLQFSTWQLLVVMTLVALLTPWIRYANWPLAARELPIFLGITGVPVVAWLSYRLTRSVWQYGLITTAFGGLFELAYSDEGPDIHGFFLLPVLVCCLWLAALDVKPDARRRLESRRRRRATTLSVVHPPAEPEPAPTPEAHLDLDA